MCIAMWRYTGRVLGLLHVTLLCFFVTSATAQSSSFLSVDCGATKTSTDGIGIEWVTDDSFISTGSNLKVSLTARPGQEAFLTSRYFPESRSKVCYVLPAVAASTYLIRAVILHGEASELPLPAKFDLTVNSNYWFTYTLVVGDEDIMTAIAHESILYNQRDHVDVCLNEAKEGIPWISSLELRLMPDNVYISAKNDDKFMDCKYRYNMGIKTNDIVRFPDDELDRVWYPADNTTFTFGDRVSNTTALPLSTGSIVGLNLPPDKVMMDAFYGPDLSFEWALADGTKEIYIATYHQEIRNVTSLQTNPVGILMGFQGSMYSLNMTNDFAYQVYDDIPVNTSKLNLTIVKQPWYDGDAILNAIEIYRLEAINSTFTSANDVTNLQILQTSFNLTSWTGDPCYPVSYSWISCDEDNRISAIYLSNKNITGTIPIEIGALSALREIHLDSNSITGSIPASLSFLTNLTVLALDNNNLSGGIPLSLQNKTGFTFTGNKNLTLCQPTDTACSNPSPSTSTPDKKSNTGVIVGVAVGVSLAVVLGIGIIVFCIRKRDQKPTPKQNHVPIGGRAAAFHSGLSPLMETKFSSKPHSTDAYENSTSWPSESLQEEGSILTNKDHPSAKANVHQVAGFISMKEVLVATRNHRKKIGEGGYGPVYYGELANMKEVAVKVNKIGAHQGTDEFVNEVALLTRVHHRNLVSLLAFCEEGDERVLIYEYQHNGTLSGLLYGPSAASKPLSWKSRLQIAIDAAKGLEYLHKGCNPPIIHRDIKSNNILIDDKMIAKVADFGISKATSDQQTTVDDQFSTIVRGTPGYLDPEYYMTQKLSQKSDVYSFGVVLMEIISGRRPTFTNPDGSQFVISHWMRQCSQMGDLSRMVDPALSGQFNPESVWKVIEVALLSVERQGVRRPDISQVIRSLTEAQEMEQSYDPNRASMDATI